MRDNIRIDRAAREQLRRFAKRVIDLDLAAPGFPDKFRELQAGAQMLLEPEGKIVGRGGGLERVRQAAVEATLENAVALHRQIRPIIDRILLEEPGLPPVHIAVRLNDAGLAPPRAKRWSVSTVRKILSRPADWSGENIA